MIICLFICLFVYWFAYFFVFIKLGHPQEDSLKISWRSDFIWLRYLGSSKLFIFVYLFVCLFVELLNCLFFILIILGHPQEYTLKILWGSDLIWLRYYGSKKTVYLFICLFVCLLVGCFGFNHLAVTTEIFPENFMKIWLDLAEIFKN